MPLRDKVVLVTGGTGSFGQKFTEMCLQSQSPKAIRIFSRGELLQVEMERKYSGTEYEPHIRFLIGDVRDRDRLIRAMNGCDVVIHAAALKHVPVAEYNPRECFLTNTMGTQNVIDAALECKVEKCVLISSDKAVQPLNLYGMTKAVAERLWIQANVYSAGGNPRFSCVRYGNVIGSRGSVVPLFMAQRKNGYITITDKCMTRFWLTLEQGVQLVFSALEAMRGGEIFVPKAPSMRVTDLAEALAHGIEQIVTGIRPGEKLHEILITKDEAPHTVDLGDKYCIEPEYHFWREDFSVGDLLPKGWGYSSDSNKQWLSIEQLKELANA